MYNIQLNGDKEKLQPKSYFYKNTKHKINIFNARYVSNAILGNLHSNLTQFCQAFMYNAILIYR